jgi:hypothetical protein
LLVEFGSLDIRFLPERLAELLSRFRIAGHDLHVEPEKVAHLVERRFQHMDRFHLRGLGERFQQFRVGWSLHGRAVKFALDDPQVVRDSQNPQVNLFHAFPVIAIHGPLSNSQIIVWQIIVWQIIVWPINVWQIDACK